MATYPIGTMAAIIAAITAMTIRSSMRVKEDRILSSHMKFFVSVSIDMPISKFGEEKRKVSDT